MRSATSLMCWFRPNASMMTRTPGNGPPPSGRETQAVIGPSLASIRTVSPRAFIAGVSSLFGVPTRLTCRRAAPIRKTPFAIGSRAAGRPAPTATGSMVRRDKTNYVIQSVAHALDVLEQFSGETEELGVTD